MSKYIDLTKSTYFPIQAISEEESADLTALKNKGWSFTNIYHLIELRNLYLALIETSFDGDIKKFSIYCSENVPYVENKWNYRKVEEYINALRNYGILLEFNRIKLDFFKRKPYNSALDSDDVDALKEIYYSYFRFKEIHTWFIELGQIQRKKQIEQLSRAKLATDSNVLYSFSHKARFTDAFISELENKTPIYFISDEISINRVLMRFWDVYVKWGKTLGVLEKFSLEHLDIGLLSKRSLNCSYHTRQGTPEYTLYDYIAKNYGKKKVYLPELVFKIALNERFSVEFIKNFIINEYIENRSLFNIDSTSEIFIKVNKITDTESILFPIYRGVYISHIIIIQ